MALVSGVGTLIVAGILANMAWVLGVIALVVGGFLTVKSVKSWLHFRGENGLYF